MPEVPTTRLPGDKRCYFAMVSREGEFYVIENADGKRSAEPRLPGSTLNKRLPDRPQHVWKFLDDNAYVFGTLQTSRSSPNNNPPPSNGDAFEEEELLRF